MKKVFVLASLFSLSSLIINPESLKINNNFKDQIYVTVASGEEMVHALINSHSTNFINYNGEIDSIIINFQLPGIKPMTITKDKIPAFLRLLTIFASRKISLS